MLLLQEFHSRNSDMGQENSDSNNDTKKYI